MTDILARIAATKRSEVETAKERISPAAMLAAARRRADPPRGFRAALAAGPRPRVIAELKRRSPSRGEIRPDFDPEGCAAAYAGAGAAAVSVLTDAVYFGGHIDLLDAVRRVVPLPLLRKDFIMDAYQVDEARARGADAVLLIARLLDEAPLVALRERARQHGLDALVEVHDEDEVGRALAAGADLIGINNRNLQNFETDLAVTERLAPHLVGAGVTVVSESGITSAADVARLETAGAHAVLVGETLMREPDVGRALAALRGRE